MRIWPWLALLLTMTGACGRDGETMKTDVPGGGSSVEGKGPAGLCSFIDLDVYAPSLRDPTLLRAGDGTLYAAFQADCDRKTCLSLGSNSGGAWAFEKLEHVSDLVHAFRPELYRDVSGESHLIYLALRDGTTQLITRSPTGAELVLDSELRGRLAVAQEGDAVHVAYSKVAEDVEEVRYATNLSGSWVIETVEASRRQDIALSVDPDGTPWLLFHGFRRDAYLAEPRPGAGWEVTPVPNLDERGAFARVATDAAGTRHVLSGTALRGYWYGTGAEDFALTEASWSKELTPEAIQLFTDDGGRLRLVALDDDGDVIRSMLLLDGAWTQEALSGEGIYRNPHFDLVTHDDALHLFVDGGDPRHVVCPLLPAP